MIAEILKKLREIKRFDFEPVDEFGVRGREYDRDGAYVDAEDIEAIIEEFDKQKKNYSDENQKKFIKRMMVKGYDFETSSLMFGECVDFLLRNYNEAYSRGFNEGIFYKEKRKLKTEDDGEGMMSSHWHKKDY